MESNSYRLLKRYQSRTNILLPQQHLPFRIKQVEYLAGDQNLSPHDKYSLDHQFPLGDNPRIQWTDSERGNSMYFRPFVFGGYQDTSAWNITGGVGARIYGNLKNNLVYYTQARIFTEQTGEKQFAHQFDPDHGETCSAEIKSADQLSKSRSCARFESYVLWDFSWFTLKLGRDRLHMGPGYFSSLTQSRSTPPFYLSEMRINFATWLTVDNYLLRMVDSDHEINKYAHIHRFEFKPFTFLSLAFQDIVIYQERDLDVKYIIPLTPLALSEDNTGGLDNDGLSLDFMYTGVSNLSLWGEVFIDDLLGPGTFFDDFWENRWSFLTGFQAVAPVKWVDLDLVLEYQRVEPWTYTGREEYTSFRHFDRISASTAGPNSQVLDMLLSWRFMKFLEFNEHYRLIEKGTDRGSSTKDIHDKQGFDDPETKEFLGGPGFTSHQFRHGLTGRYRQNLSGMFFISNDDKLELGVGTRLQLSI